MNESTMTVEKSTHRVEVIEIKELLPHPNSDGTLSIVKIYDYVCVVKTAEWKVGDLGAWIPPDSLLDVTRSEFAFLVKGAKEGKVRIRTKKIRGIVSYGLLINSPEGLKVGEDAAESLNVTHWEPEFNPGYGITGGEAAKPPAGVYPKYDVDSFMKYGREIFITGEPVWISEKINGCLQYQTNVTMADGSKKKIGKIVNDNLIGQEVLGYDEKTKMVVSTKILNVFKNGSTNKWLRIAGSRTHAGQGNYCFVVYVTPNHKFYVNGKYTEARKIKKGDKVLNVRTDLGITPIQEQVVLGKLLGDAFFAVHGPTTASINFGHKKTHEEYVDWTLRGLGDLGDPHKYYRTSGYGTKMAVGRCHSNIFVYNKFKSFIIKEKGKNRKVIPPWVADELTPLALAFTYMDDGQEDRVTFALCDFTEEDCTIFQKGLSKLGIKSGYHIYNDYPIVTLNADNAEKLFLLVAPYITKCMQYKLPKRYRGHKGWLPNLKSIYKKWIVEQTVDSIEEVEESGVKYDIETETHNFFANDILVHNSNGKFVFKDGEMHCGSRTEFKREFPTKPNITFEELVKQYNGDDEKAKNGWRKIQNWKPVRNLWWIAYSNTPAIFDFCSKNPGYTLYGEVFGQVGGGWSYGIKSASAVRFVAFDILSPEGRWLDFTEFLTICKKYFIPTPPILHESIPFDFDEVVKMAEGNTLIEGATHIKEGIVLCPIKERWDDRVGRVKFKVINPEY